MARYKMICSYDGYNYMGFQIQNALPTIELELQKAFYKVCKEEVKIYPSGRTDRYVHAIGQVFHVDITSNIPPSGLQRGLNSFLPADIYIRDCAIVDDTFHARFSAVSKEYRYYINTKEYNPITLRYMPYIPNLDIVIMKEAVKHLIGTHDFKGFASASIDPRKSTVKAIFDIQILSFEDHLEFRFIGDGFLKYQIRRMMGILVEIGKHHFLVDKIDEILESKNPCDSKYILDGCGLYLYQV
ncbi:MAG: tRNA pseudouridine(38-40) synthase TruA, partial [Anaeroplasmataceae bacterium]|nr:tRNA pseudouridine(38-40) synthase TruA [Anaeroplasmataceae bacterium]